MIILLKKGMSKKHTSLFLLILMLGSTFAYSLLQSYGYTKFEEKEVELPEKNIIDYELDVEQKNYLIKRGYTILEYKYPLGCNNCNNDMLYMESLVNEFPKQLFLEEIVENNITTSELEILSYYGSSSIENPNQNEIMDGICQYMINAPVRCATRNI